VGALMSQLGSCSQGTLEVAHYAQQFLVDDEDAVDLSTRVAPASELLQQLQRFCDATGLAGLPPPHELLEAHEPAAAFLHAIMTLLCRLTSGGSDSSSGGRQQHAVAPQQPGAQQQHPAAALRKLLAVLLSALCFKHAHEAQQ
jgi:hypothetical protein